MKSLVLWPILLLTVHSQSQIDSEIFDKFAYLEKKLDEQRLELEKTNKKLEQVLAEKKQAESWLQYIQYAFEKEDGMSDEERKQTYKKLFEVPREGKTPQEIIEMAISQYVQEYNADPVQTSNRRHLDIGGHLNEGGHLQKWSLWWEGDETFKQFFSYTRREPYDAYVVTILTAIMLTIYIINKFIFWCKTPPEGKYSTLVENSDYVDPHKDCPEDDDPPMLLNDDYRLCKLLSKAEGLGIKTTFEQLSEFRESVHATKIINPDDVYAQLDLVQAVRYLQKQRLETCEDPVQRKELVKDIIFLGKQEDYAKNTSILCAVGQFMSLMYVLHEVLMHRKIAVLGWWDWLARIIFSLIVLKSVESDMKPIAYSRGLYQLHLHGNDFLDFAPCMARCCFRFGYNVIAAVVIPFFILTIDEEGEETGLDLVKDFTALIIMIEIDNMVTSSTIETLVDQIQDLGQEELLMRSHEEENFSLGYASFVAIWLFFILALVFIFICLVCLICLYFIFTYWNMGLGS